MRAKKKFKGTKTLEFQWREEDLNALFRGPEPRVLTATLSRNSRPAVWAPPLGLRGICAHNTQRALFVNRYFRARARLAVVESLIRAGP